MGGLDKVEKSLIVALVVSVVATLFLAGFSIYSYWYVGTHHDYGTETVRTGDVTWACLAVPFDEHETETTKQSEDAK